MFLVQYFDLVIIKLLIRLCQENNNFIPTKIHDCGSSYANNFDLLILNLETVFCEVFCFGKINNKKLLENIWLTLTSVKLKEFVDEKDLDSIKIILKQLLG